MKEYSSSTATTIHSQGVDWADAYKNAFAGTPWGADTTSSKTEKTEKHVNEVNHAEHVNDVPTCVKEAQYNDYVEKHICPEPEQCMCTPEDFIEAASAGCDHFDSVLGELPDATPEPRPEMDAEYTKVEKEVIEEVVEKAVEEVKPKTTRTRKTTTTTRTKKTTTK